MKEENNKMSEDREKSLIYEYEKIRRQGQFNMMIDSNYIAKNVMKCTEDEYMYVLFNYNELMEKYKIKELF